MISLKLLTKEILKLLPPLGSQAEEDDPIVVCKFFTPDAQWTWYAVEFDGVDTFYGYVVGDYSEHGYFSLVDVRRWRGALGLPVERDLYFSPRRLSVVKRER